MGLSDRALAVCIALGIAAGVLCGTAPASGAEAKLQALDVVRVAGGAATVQLGEKTVATLEAGTLMIVSEVDGDWVGVAVENAGRTVRGWVHRKHLARVPRPSAQGQAATKDVPAAAEPGETVPAIATRALSPRDVRILRIDGKESVRTVVPGGWISIDEQMAFCYWTGAELRFERNGPLVYVSEKGGPRRVAGLDVARAPDGPGAAARLAAASQGAAEQRMPLTVWLAGESLADLAWLAPLCAERPVAVVVTEPPGADLAPLAKLGGLAALCLDRCRDVADLGPLASLESLRSLALINCPDVADLAPLAKLARLEVLRLHGRSKVADYSPLAKLRRLHSLYVYQANGVATLAPLGSLTRLTSLHLIACGAIDDLAPLGKLRGLRTLTLGPCPNVGDLAPLGELTELTSLRVIGNKWARLTDLGPLAKLTELTSLSLIACEEVADLSPLGALGRLTELSVGETRASDLAPLARLTRLATLDLHSSPNVADLSPLASLTELTSLDLSRCPKLTDLAPLARLPRLLSVDLRHGPKDIDITPLRDVALRGGKVLVDKPPTLDPGVLLPGQHAPGNGQGQ